MSAIDEILAQIPMDELARQLGADEATTEKAVRQALPALLGGMEANAQHPGGAESLAEAVGQHDPKLIEGGVDLDDVDTKDGAKIVKHVFGANQGKIVDQISDFMGGSGGDLVKKLLPILAPIVLAWLAKKFGGGAGAATGDGQQGSPLGGLVDVLGGLLGGASGGASTGGAGQAGQIVDILGGLLGAGRR